MLTWNWKWCMIQNVDISIHILSLIFISKWLKENLQFLSLKSEVQISYNGASMVHRKLLLIENLECTSVRPVGAEHRSIVDSSVNRVLLCSSCFPNSHTDRGDTMPCNNNSCCFFSPNVWTSSKIGRINSNRFVKWCGLRFWFCK